MCNNLLTNSNDNSNNKLNFAPKETVFTYWVVTHFRFALFVIAIVRLKLNLCFVGRTTYFKVGTSL